MRERKNARAFSWIRGRWYPDVPGLANEVCAKTLGLGRSLRITVEILFGSLAADNKVPHSRGARDPPSILSTGECISYLYSHTYTRASARTMGGHHGRSLFHDSHPNSQTPRSSPCHLLSPTYLATPSNWHICKFVNSCVVALLW